MRTVRTKVYKFSELSERAKKAAIAEFQDININHTWYDYIIDEFKVTAKDRGFDVEEVYFSGFHSQGDGAMFEGEINNVTSFLEGVDKRVIRLIEKGLITVSCEITRNGHYYHERSGQFSFDWQSDNVYALKNIQNEMNKIESNIREIYICLCRTLYADLENAYEDLTSEEQIIASIESNEYEFYSNGEFYKG